MILSKHFSIPPGAKVRLRDGSNLHIDAAYYAGSLIYYTATSTAGTVVRLHTEDLHPTEHGRHQRITANFEYIPGQHVVYQGVCRGVVFCCGMRTNHGYVYGVLLQDADVVEASSADLLADDSADLDHCDWLPPRVGNVAETRKKVH